MYKLQFMATDGAIITNSMHKDKTSAWQEASNIGSKWIFYPIALIASDKNYIVDIVPELEFFRGKRVSTLQYYASKNSSDLASLLL